MRRPEQSFARQLSLHMRSLDQRTRQVHAENSDWIWTVPVLSSLGTLAIFVSIGQLSGVGFAVSVPIGIIAALVMAGMSIVYMTPGDWTESGDEEARPRAQHASPDPGIHRVSSLPPSAWMSVNAEGDLEQKRDGARVREHAGRQR